LVKTELEEREYDLLSGVAKKKGLTIEEAARQALLDWSVSGLKMKKDPLSRLKTVRLKRKIKSSEIDRFTHHADESKTLGESERRSLPKLKPFVREKHDRFD